MLSVTDASEMLAVSSARVRALIKEGLLPAQKVGNRWVLEEKDVLQRKQAHKKAGRPAYAAGNMFKTNRSENKKRIKQGKKIYANCCEFFRYLPDAALIKAAESEEEASFYMAVADFFLQQEQEKLVKAGVF